MVKIKVISLLIITLLIACSPVRQITPLEPKQSSVSLGIGGPITRIGAIYIPVPMLSVGYNYGLIKNLDIETGLYITSASFKIGHIDAGVNWRPLQPEGLIPGLIVSPRLFLTTNFEPNSVRLFPDCDLTAWWTIASNRHIYVGLQNWFELHTVRYDNQKQKYNWLLCPFTGFEIGNDRWQFQIEARLYTPNILNTGKPTKNIGLGDYGVLGGFMGLSRDFGGGK